MKLEVLADVESVARHAAELIAGEARAAVQARGRFTVAISGGRTPWLMLRALSSLDVPWKNVHVLQVDERIAPAGHADRNLTHLCRESVPARASPGEQIHAMPVESADLDAAAARYAQTLVEIAGSPPILDLVHLGRACICGAASCGPPHSHQPIPELVTAGRCPPHDASRR